jgi:hypothetical protein
MIVELRSRVKRSLSPPLRENKKIHVDRADEKSVEVVSAEAATIVVQFVSRAPFLQVCPQPMTKEQAVACLRIWTIGLQTWLQIIRVVARPNTNRC